MDMKPIEYAFTRRNGEVAHHIVDPDCGTPVMVQVRRFMEMEGAFRAEPILPCAMALSIPGRGMWPVTSLAEASALYELERERSGEGASTFPTGVVVNDDVPMGRVSYNGRIWPVEPWAPGVVPIYDPRSNEVN